MRLSKIIELVERGVAALRWSEARPERVPMQRRATARETGAYIHNTRAVTHRMQAPRSVGEGANEMEREWAAADPLLVPLLPLLLLVHVPTSLLPVLAFDTICVCFL